MGISRITGRQMAGVPPIEPVEKVAGPDFDMEKEHLKRLARQIGMVLGGKGVGKRIRLDPDLVRSMGDKEWDRILRLPESILVEIEPVSYDYFRKHLKPGVQEDFRKRFRRGR